MSKVKIQGKKPDVRRDKALKELKEKYSKKILIYGAPCNRTTGNGKLIYHMAKAFQSAGHTVWTIGIEYNRLQINFEGIPIFPSFHCERCGNAHKGSDDSVMKIADYMNMLYPDYLICVGDSYQIQQFGIGNLSFEKSKTKTIMYATYDSILYDEPILIRVNGKIINLKKIGALVDGFFEIDILHRKEGIIPVANIEVPTFDEKFNIVWKKVDSVYRHKNKEKKYRVTTTNGLSIDLTSSHSIFRTKIKKRVRTQNQKINVEVVKTNELKKGEYLFCPSKIINNKGIKEINVFNILKTINVDGLKRSPKDYRTKKDSNKFWINTSSFYKKIKIDNLLAKFMGWYVAEGCTNYQNNAGRIDLALNPHKDKEGINTCKKICKRFSLKYHIAKTQKNCISFQINSKPFALFLDFLFKKGAKNKRIPQLLFNFPQKKIKAFIDAWIEGDYGSSVNKDLISDINYLGLLIGRRYSIYTHKRKGKKVIFNKVKGKREVILKNDMYQAIGEKKNNGHTGLRSFRKIKDTAFLQIKKIEEIKYNKPYVYDLCVKDNNQFLAGKGGIFVHNSEGIFCNDILTEDGLKDYTINCDRVIATAKFGQQQLKEWLDIDADVIYEIVNYNEIYLPVSKDKRIELKKKYRFKEDDFVIYSSGRNLKRKRNEILLDAAAKFICETKNTYLYLNIPMSVAGERQYFPDGLNPLDFVRRVLKKKYGRDLVAEKRIIFIDRGGLGSTQITEWNNAELYQMSDLYLTTTGGEGFGLTPVESMACGTPVIIPDNSTGKEIIGIEDTKCQAPESGFQFGKGGLLLNCLIEEWTDFGTKQQHTTTENTYNAIKFMYNDPELRENLGKQGREHIEKTFNMDEFRMKWLEVVKVTEKKPINKEREEFKSVEMEGEKNDGSTS